MRSGCALGLLGVLLVVAGIIGDLFESMLKRAADMKDSATSSPATAACSIASTRCCSAAPVFYFFLR